ncbi:MAG: hypothetical protein B5766_07995 [Candidatus Lumbricidophila eiseniae]|uniref:FAD-dependent oxidoreductase n=1 Tax=Candidatus Lumbricidiphila eiseniae TaxID=1969409 RepID=A0A2A6FQV6_9MICO|nr:MAG: hypothetical protein B5766_07995 [Candidatus Lumbricidophila eiseniae]
MNEWISGLPIITEADVLVVGSGSAGVPAAIAAARSGASVVLVEKMGFLGGTSTAVLDTFYGFYTPGDTPRRVVAGIGSEVVDELRKLGPVLERPNTFGAGTGITYHPEHLKVAWENMALTAGVTVLLHTVLQAVRIENGRILDVAVATKAGLQRISTRVVVDATGDADVCFHAGLKFETAGHIFPAQTLTTTFRMGNVDVTRRKTITKETLHDLMKSAAATGRYEMPRHEGSDHVTPVDGVMATIMTRLPSTKMRDGKQVNATDPIFLSAAEIEGRKQALEYVRFLKDMVPGYEHADLVWMGTQIGVRETRRIQGLARLTKEDVLSARQFEDQIALCGAPIEDHHEGTDTRWHYIPNGGVVGIPYRTLVPEGAQNIVVAGRCFSATHDGHASVRSMAQCMAMGEAAGTAAAMSSRQDCSVADIDTDELRHTLRSQGAIVEELT